MFHGYEFRVGTACVCSGGAASAVPDAADEFDQWLASDSDIGLSTRLLFDKHRLHLLHYDNSKCVSVDNLASLSDELTGAGELSAADEIATACNRLLTSDYKKWGITAADYLILRLLAPQAGSQGKLMLVNTSAIHTVTGKLFPDSHFTPAENRLSIQLLCGDSLKEAAANDQVSYETKCSQLKSIQQKSGITRQIDLTNFLLAHVLMEAGNLTGDSAKDSTQDFFRHYLQKYLPPSVRLHVLTDDEGMTHRVLDMGSLQRRPLIALHPQVIPWLGQAELELIEKQGLRVVWPLRHGALAPKDTTVNSQQYMQHMQHALRGIELTCNLLFDNKADLMGLVSGACYALQYARQNPRLVDRLILVGACHKPVRGGSAAGKLRNGLFELAAKSEWMMDRLIYFLQRKIRDPAQFQRLLQRGYASSAADSKILNIEFSDSVFTDALHSRFLQSPQSVKFDFYFQSRTSWQLDDLHCNIDFVHGADDQIHRLGDVQSLAANNGSRLITLEHAGQLIYHDHFQSVMEAVMQLLDMPRLSALG